MNAPPNWNALAAWSTVVIALLSAVYGYGVQSSRIDSIEDQVNSLRADTKENNRLLSSIAVSSAKIEGKFDVLVPTPKEAKQ